MILKKIVGFGDSWMWGDELLDPRLAGDPNAHPVVNDNDAYRQQHCFLGLLGQHYQVPVENFGLPGGSMQSTIWTYLWWLQNETVPRGDCMVLIMLTESDRQSFFNPTPNTDPFHPPWDQFEHSTWVDNGCTAVPRDYQQLIKQHMVLTNCSRLRTYNYLQTVLFFDGQRALGQPLLQFNLMQPMSNIPAQSLIWPDFCWTVFFQDHPQNRNRELVKPGGHPNEIGHKLMADMLIPEIDRVILAGC